MAIWKVIGPIMAFTYVNHRGETSRRAVIPESIRFGSSDYYEEPQWLMEAYDTEKKAIREFAMGKMSDVSNKPGEAWSRIPEGLKPPEKGS